MMTILTENASEGMVLAADVVDSFRRVLFRRGHRLLQRHIEVLKHHGIPEIGVVENSVPKDGAGPSEAYQQCAHDLEERFLLTDRTWDVMGAVFDGAVRAELRKREEP